MTLIKICGLTRAEDAALAEELGADLLGFVFVPESPRHVTPEQVRDIGSGGAAGFSPPDSVGGLKPAAPQGRARRVGVFRNAPLHEIRRAIEVARLDVVQIHDESGRSAAALLNVPVIHAFHVRETLPDAETSADYVLFDTGGGTGRTFDWALLANYPRTKPFFLAGGITPDNVSEALRGSPDGIDLSSGVERAPGIKDHDKLRALFARIRR